jgi:hypothetical protein
MVLPCGFLFGATRPFKILVGTNFYAVAYNLKRAECKIYFRLLFSGFTAATRHFRILELELHEARYQRMVE